MPLGDFLQPPRISSFTEMPMRHETKQGSVDQHQVRSHGRQITRGSSMALGAEMAKLTATLGKGCTETLTVPPPRHFLEAQDTAYRQ